MILELEKLTAQVCEVARKAGDYLRKEQQMLDRSQVEQKHTHDYVSYVDKCSEKFIVAELSNILIAGFVTEEGTAQHHGEPYWWVIDPLDGTTNYIHGGHPYAVSIALRSAEEVLLGVVYEVVADECFYAWKGGGAWHNGKPIHVNEHNDITQALLGIELPYQTDYKNFGIYLIRHFYGLAGGIRMNGSAAVALCNVASGRWDGWIEKYIGPWDFMAGLLIVREAGGMITDFQGDENCLEQNSIVASNGSVHKELIEKTEKFSFNFLEI